MSKKVVKSKSAWKTVGYHPVVVILTVIASVGTIIGLIIQLYGLRDVGPGAGWMKISDKRSAETQRSGQILLRYNSKGQLVEASGLCDPESMCHDEPEEDYTIRKVFRDSGGVQGIEAIDASEHLLHVNVDAPYLGQNLAMAWRASVLSQFQENNKLRMVVVRCGAAGRVMFVKSIKPHYVLR